MSEQHTAYPLCWPAGWPVTKVREKARFQTTLSAALKMLENECRLLGGTDLLLSSNCTLGNENPKECGVVAYFKLKEGQAVKNLAIPCDRWNTVKDNVKAIALTIEALRGMDRWGAKHMISAMFQGFIALPHRTGPSCWDVLHIIKDELDRLLPADQENLILMQWKVLAKMAHPDAGGSQEAMVELNNAKDIALASIK